MNKTQITEDQISDVTMIAYGVVTLGDTPNAATLARRGILFRDKDVAMRYAASLNKKLGTSMFGIRRVMLNATKEKKANV